jgi:hypothetical protein
MTRGIFQPRDRLIRVVLNRTGTPADIKQPSNPGENKYGKVADTDRSYTVVATEDAYRTYGSYEERPRDMPEVGGDADMDTPRIIFKRDTAANEGYRVEFDDGEVYELDVVVPRETHKEFRATIVDG